MSTTIDNKVVEMTFDNSKFESNVKESLSTLEKLKKALEFKEAGASFKELENAANNTDMSTLGSAVESLKERFSSVGIIGMTVLQRLTNSAMDAASKVLSMASKVGSFFTKSIVQGGISRAMNIEDAKFMLNGIKIAWDDIKDDIDYGVKDTAYGLDAAAKVASQLAASGIKVGKGMQSALRGVSGVAAMTNSSYEEIGSIFTTVAGQGKLMTMQLRQLELRGMNAAASIGQVIGKTEAEVRDMVTKGKIDFETFSFAMNQAFGEHAKEANKTFNGSLANIKAALARIGAEFVQPLIQNEGPIVNMFNSIRQAANEVKAEVGPFVKDFTYFAENVLSKISKTVSGTTSSWNQFNQKIEACHLSTTSFKEEILEASKNTSVYGKKLYETLSTADDFGKALGDSGQASKLVTEVLKENINVLKDYSEEELKAEGYTKDDIKAIKKLVKEINTANTEASNFIKTLSGKSKIEKFMEVLVNIKDSIKNIASAFSPLITNIKKAWDSFDLFPIKSLDHFISITENIKKLTSEFKLSKSTIADLTSIFKGFFAAIDICKQVIDALITPVKSLLGITGKFGGGILSIIAKISSLIVSIDNAIKKSELISKVTDTIYEKLNAFFGFIKKTITVPALDNIKGALDAVGAALEKLISSVRKTKDETVKAKKDIDKAIDLESIKDIITTIWKAIVKVGNKISEVVGKIITSVSSAFGKIDFSKLMDNVSLVTLIGLLTEVATSVSKSFDAVETAAYSVEKFTKNINGILSNVKSVLVEYQREIKADIIIKIAVAIFLLAAAVTLLVEAGEKTDQLAYATGAMLGLMAGLAGLMFVMDKLGTVTGIFKKKSVPSLLKIAAAILVMAIAMKLLSTIQGDQLISAIAGIFIVVLLLKSLLKTIGKMNKDIKVAIKGLTTLGVALILMAVAMKILSTMTWQEALVAGGSLTVIIGLLVAACVLLSNHTKRFKDVAKGVIPLSVAIGILALIFKELGEMSWGQVAIASTSLLAICALLVASAILLSNNTKRFKSISIGLIPFAAAIAILANVAKMLGLMPMEQAVQAAIGMGLLCTYLVASAVILSKYATKLGIASVGLIPFSASIAILAGIAKIIGNMPMNEAVQAAIGLGLLCTYLVGSAAILSSLNPVKLIASAAGVIMLTTALQFMVPVIAALSAISVVGLIKAFGSLAAIIGVFYLAAVTIGQPAILGALAKLSAVMLALSVALAIAGAGITLFATGFVILTSSLVAGSTAIIAALSIIIAGVISLIPLIVEAIASLISRIIEAIANTFDTIVGALKTIFSGIIEAIKAVVPDLINLVITIIKEIVMALATNIPLILQTLVTGLGNCTASIISAAGLIAKIVLETINTVLTAIADNIGPIVESVVTIVVNVIEALAGQLPAIAQAAADLILAFIDALADTIRKNSARAEKSMWNLITALIEAAIKCIKGLWEDVKSAGKKLIGGKLFEGFHLGGLKIPTKVKEILSNAVKAIGNMWNDFKEAGKNMIKGMISGIFGSSPDLKSAAKDAAKKALDAAKNFLGIKSPSRAFMEVGRYCDEGMAVGLSKYANKVEKSTESVGKKALNSMSDVISSIADSFNSDYDVDPTITPVLDLSEIQNGAKYLNGFLGDYDNIDIGSSLNMSSLAASAMGNYNLNNPIDALRDTISGLSTGVVNNEFHNTFDVSGFTGDTDELAMRISEKLQSQVERTDAVWA